MGYVVTCNAGSSSLKVAVFSSDNGLEELHTAQIENIGQAQTMFYAPDSEPQQVDVANHAAAIRLMVSWIDEVVGKPDVVAVGHRVVHGATFYHEATNLDNIVIEHLNSLSDLDPDHMPAILESITEMRQYFPEQPHVACFDTAFYAELPKRASMLPIPRKFYDEGLRRYGFHGLSYRYLLQSFTQHEGEVAANGKIILAHLGSGASLAAVKGGKVQDMTMGFTPASGVLMSTRSGDLDPGIVKYLSKTYGQSADEFNDMINHHSGLLGISETSADMHTLLQNQSEDIRAAEAIEQFCYQITKSIGALSASLGGLNSLIFAGGIGERSAEVRARICENLAFLGIQIDAAKNERSERLISAEASTVGVHVIPTDEAYEIARQTLKKTKEGEG